MFLMEEDHWIEREKEWNEEREKKLVNRETKGVFSKQKEWEKKNKCKW